MSNLCIIPARGGSKRIPKKNIIDFFGKPMISYAIETALNSKLFDEVMVSTDSSEIAKIAKKFGAKVPFIRSKENATDKSPTIDVLLEVLKYYSSKGEKFNYVCCLYPFTPLITNAILHNTFELIKSNDVSSVFPAVPYSHPVQRGFTINKSGIIDSIDLESLKKRTQSMKKVFHDAGQFYWFRPEILKKTKSIVNSQSKVFEMNQLEVHDVDTLEDLELVKLKYKLLTNGNQLL